MIRASAPPITRSYRFIRNFSPHLILLYLLCSLLSSILFYSTLLSPFSFLSPSISSSTSNHPFRSIHPFSLHTNPITITTPSPDLLSTSIKTGSLPNSNPTRTTHSLPPGRSSPTPLVALFRPPQLQSFYVTAEEGGEGNPTSSQFQSNSPG
ncbi:hypothetical protein BDQ94DRAFT_142839 [Aspergillus welwitschiae]|uniref:Uncharacterized protein n=1 Tax=Aspergillus welwitschiae TaxID=1341132 RepID=A0A3F3Q428_9EURO|nr:hypothetical protein BDQ94DRAFT_142839 [Aspergillus welwitschiae]RDH33881.1 hypothetical protein BDQ94DRAFT_142839 [Aspergillus welwitschiae]